MMEIIGWIAFAAIGAYFVAGGAFLVTMMRLQRDGLGAVGPALMAALLSCLVWIGFVAWLSPIQIGWTP